jgi:SnoaL-like protein
MPASSAADTTSPAAGAATLGSRFAEALGRKDFDAITQLLDPDVDFRGLTPGRSWEATSAEGVDGILRRWFEESDELKEIVAIESDSVSDRHRVSYRFHGRNPDGSFVVEQQAYYTEAEGRINWMRVLCSGFRPR